MKEVRKLLSTLFFAVAATAIVILWPALPLEAQVGEERNASHLGFDRLGGRALNQDAIAPGPETFDESLAPGSDSGKPSPSSGTVDPLGAGAAATTASLGLPGLSPPLPPQPELPVICETCGLSRKYTVFK